MIRDLLMGIRLAFTGGRPGALRLAMSVLGVGMGLALLLGAASLPALIDGYDVRRAARDAEIIESIPRSDASLAVAGAHTKFRDDAVYGQLIWPDGPAAPHPPGVAKLPGDGEMVVSPALADLLASPDGRLLRPRVPYRTVGVIGDEGLLGPGELAFYAGSKEIADAPDVNRVGAFGYAPGPRSMPALLALLAGIALVTLLLPVGVFVAVAVRFGGEQRDRRLAAIRLMGGDRRMIRRVAAGEALVAGVLGIAAGAAMFFAFRPLIELVSIANLSGFAADLRPDPAFAALAVLGVLVTSGLVMIAGLRGVTVEPLRVFRQSQGRPRRLWWRLLLPAAGVALLVGGSEQSRTKEQIVIAAGALLVLAGAAVLLPWLVEAVLRRFGGGGPLPWQLATRRLQFNAGGPARAIAGLAVTVVGGIGLQMFITGVETSQREFTGADTGRVQFSLRAPHDLAAKAADTVAASPVAAPVTSFDSVILNEEGVSLIVADCPALAELATVRGCKPGSTFLVKDPDDIASIPKPGDGVTSLDAEKAKWRIPATARSAKARHDLGGRTWWGVYATPEAVPERILGSALSVTYFSAERNIPDWAEHARNLAPAVGPNTFVDEVNFFVEPPKLTNLKRVIFAGTVTVLCLIGAGLFVAGLEQLRERRELLASLAAAGIRKRTLGQALLWQNVIPALIGLVPAAASGYAFGLALLAMTGLPEGDVWPLVSGVTGAGLAAALMVTAAMMPSMWRLARPDGLRTE